MSSINEPILVCTNDHNPVIRSGGAIDSDDLSNIEPEIGAIRWKYQRYCSGPMNEEIP